MHIPLSVGTEIVPNSGAILCAVSYLCDKFPKSAHIANPKEKTLASDDGREIVLAIEALREEGLLEREPDTGRYRLTAA
jgi:hypothetical protein